jgi:primosomal protein N'
MAVADTIRCSHCGAPVEFKPGEIIATCKYCGFRCDRCPAYVANVGRMDKKKLNEG